LGSTDTKFLKARFTSYHTSTVTKHWQCRHIVH